MKFTKNKLFLIIVIILAIVAAAVWYFGIFSIKPEKPVSAKKSTVAATADTKKAPDSKFANLKGDAFDEAYIADMLAHHEGAVNMSEQAMSVTAHEEIRTLASNITQSQSEQMIQMRDWQAAWGYKITNSGGHMNHGGGGAQMAGDMVEMMAKLKDLTGEAYDKEYLKQMITHHQQAIEMSVYADANAKHQEVKDLARDVMSAQKSEITQMKSWQREWSYES